MEIKVSKLNGFTVVAIKGRVDTMTAGDFENEISKVLEEGVSGLILDCSDLDYISSSGLRVFLVAQKNMMGKGGSLRLCCLKPEIKEIFDISGFSTIFSIFPDIEKAASE